jgi:hypothetical protein
MFSSTHQFNHCGPCPLLALPIWIMAVYGGVTVVWRDRRFKVGFDAKVRDT